MESNKQPVVFILEMLHVLLHIDEFTFIAYAQKRHPDII